MKAPEEIPIDKFVNICPCHASTMNGTATICFVCVGKRRFIDENLMKAYVEQIHKEEIEKILREQDEFALAFADYMETDRWMWDHTEQKKHTMKEHLEHFKQLSNR